MIEIWKRFQSFHEKSIAHFFSNINRGKGAKRKVLHIKQVETLDFVEFGKKEGVLILLRIKEKSATTQFPYQGKFVLNPVLEG